MTHSPLTIEIMIACYTLAEPSTSSYSFGWNSSAARQVRSELGREGLICVTKNNEYRATPKGAAWVKFICQTPYPEATWTLPDRKNNT